MCNFAYVNVLYVAKSNELCPYVAQKPKRSPSENKKRKTLSI